MYNIAALGIPDNASEVFFIRDRTNGMALCHQGRALVFTSLDDAQSARGIYIRSVVDAENPTKVSTFTNVFGEPGAMLLPDKAARKLRGLQLEHNLEIVRWELAI